LRESTEIKYRIAADELEMHPEKEIALIRLLKNAQHTFDIMLNFPAIYTEYVQIAKSYTLIECLKLLVQDTTKWTIINIFRKELEELLELK
jgi:hypothetical protein